MVASPLMAKKKSSPLRLDSRSKNSKKDSRKGVVTEVALAAATAAAARDDEMRSAPLMCGHEVLNKLRRKPPLNFGSLQPLSITRGKGILGGRGGYSYRNFEGDEAVANLLGGNETEAPDTESYSGSDLSKEDMIMIHLESSLPPPQIVQFDPVELEIVHREKEDYDQQLEETKEMEAAAASAAAAAAASNRRGASSMVGNNAKGNTVTWETTLPAVVEERSFEMEDVSTTTRENRAGVGGEEVDVSFNEDVDFTPSEQRELLASLRELVLKQQVALKELSDENIRYRHDLLQCQHELLEHMKDRTQKQDTINELFQVKQKAESEAECLRRELKSVKEELEAMKQAEDDRLMRQFQMLMDNDNANMASPNNSDISNASNHRNKNHNMSGSKSESTLDEDEEEEEENGDEEDAFLKFKQALMPQSQNELASTTSSSSSNSAMRSQGSGETVDDNTALVPSKLGNQKGSKEEVALFKNRLEAIQQKRMQRRTERSKVHKTVVRF